jgi:hypothetical protein
LNAAGVWIRWLRPWTWDSINEDPTLEVLKGQIWRGGVFELNPAELGNAAGKPRQVGEDHCLPLTEQISNPVIHRRFVRTRSEAFLNQIFRAGPLRHRKNGATK